MRDAEHVRGLVEGKSEVVVQDDHRPLIGREPAEAAFQLVAVGEFVRGVGHHALPLADLGLDRPPTTSA